MTGGSGSLRQPPANKKILPTDCAKLGLVLEHHNDKKKIHITSYCRRPDCCFGPGHAG
jgi:hypothetical protein